MKVRPLHASCPEHGEHTLSPDREYEVLAIEAGYYRILNDAETYPYGNDPALYDPECFVITDPVEPEFWESEDCEGLRYSQPVFWPQYFFEQYHDGDEQRRRDFLRDLRCYFPWTWNERFGMV